ncbi:hypothetical protein L2E82_04017 [Cichorium intybus]|uniref:Uncharacterized protein n=1 Tax=Cichorium intybus TaxID=13427 RepID=A0ACB9H4X7_CICIN|nr:hypothetical protein L2E82_04017 [Cichorium intybus]
MVIDEGGDRSIRVSGMVASTQVTGELMLPSVVASHHRLCRRSSECSRSIGGGVVLPDRLEAGLIGEGEFRSENRLTENGEGIRFRMEKACEISIASPRFRRDSVIDCGNREATSQITNARRRHA